MGRGETERFVVFWLGSMITGLCAIWAPAVTVVPVIMLFGYAADQIIAAIERR